MPQGLYTEISGKKPAIEEVNVLGGRFVREAKVGPKPLCCLSHFLLVVHFASCVVLTLLFFCLDLNIFKSTVQLSTLLHRKLKSFYGSLPQLEL